MTADNEPWVPPGYAERLVVGARVRVQLSAECDTCAIASAGVGVIVEIDARRWPVASIRSHPYLVAGEVPPFCWYYAASELEVLD